MARKMNHLVYQFKVNLAEIEPPIWRRIQVPAKYTFWDLHVAIQDSFGWLDYHLHAFRGRLKHKRKPFEIGIPGGEWDGEVVIPGWELPLADHFNEPGQTLQYDYDFGDGWEHTVLLEGIILAEEGVSYPRVVAGGRACPPEDCGGVHGYNSLLEILRDPANPEYEEYLEWVENHGQNFRPYDPDKFDPLAVHFDNPKKRWQIAFSKK